MTGLLVLFETLLRGPCCVAVWAAHIVRPSAWQVFSKLRGCAELPGADAASPWHACLGARQVVLVVRGCGELPVAVLAVVLFGRWIAWQVAFEVRGSWELFGAEAATSLHARRGARLVFLIVLDTLEPHFAGPARWVFPSQVHGHCDSGQVRFSTYFARECALVLYVGLQCFCRILIAAARRALEDVVVCPFMVIALRFVEEHAVAVSAHAVLRHMFHQGCSRFVLSSAELAPEWVCVHCPGVH